MATGMNLVEKAAKCLRDHPDQRFEAREIAEWIIREYPEDCKRKRRGSKAKRPLDTDKALASQLAAELGAQRASLQDKHGIKITAEKPRKFYYTERSDEAEVKEAEHRDRRGLSSARRKQTIASAGAVGEKALKEHDLYPMVLELIRIHRGVYGKWIDETKSRNIGGRGSNRWLHPDLVGLENLSARWHKEITECVFQAGETKSKLWSLEVKKLINRSNARECFFQAVSNSSWANVGYLVAATITEDASREIGILSDLHGIGLIRLEIEDPSESQILLPARERTEVDWATANRVAKVNPDFMKFVKLVRAFYQTKEINPSDWDTPQIEDD